MFLFLLLYLNLLQLWVHKEQMMSFLWHILLRFKVPKKNPIHCKKCLSTQPPSFNQINPIWLLEFLVTTIHSGRVSIKSGFRWGIFLKSFSIINAWNFKIYLILWEKLNRFFFHFSGKDSFWKQKERTFQLYYNYQYHFSKNEHFQLFFPWTSHILTQACFNY